MGIVLHLWWRTLTYVFMNVFYMHPLCQQFYQHSLHFHHVLWVKQQISSCKYNWNMTAFSTQHFYRYYIPGYQLLSDRLHIKHIYCTHKNLFCNKLHHLWEQCVNTSLSISHSTPWMRSSGNEVIIVKYVGKFWRLAVCGLHEYGNADGMASTMESTMMFTS